MKLFGSLGLLIVIALEPVMAQQPPKIDFGKNYTVLGQIQPRTTHEIVGSDLWIGGEVLDRDYADYHSYKYYLDSLGAKKIRLQSGWAKTEHARGEYNFDWLDSIVNDVLEREIEPWLQVSYGNSIYPGAGGTSLGEGLPSSKEGMNAWLNYVTALVRHFKGRVNQWEIWNEADHKFNNASSDAYSSLYYQTALAIREEQPSAFLVGMSLASVGSKPAYVDTFFTYLQKRNGLHLIDAVSFHGYPKNPDFSSHERLRKVVYKYRPGLPLWQGETGCPSTLGSSGALSGHPWTELTQAKYNLRRAVFFVGRGMPFSLFTISDYVYTAKAFTGLNTKGILVINEDKSVKRPKIAYYAYQHLTSVLDHQVELLLGFSVEAESDSSLAMYSFRHKLTKCPMIFVYRNAKIPSQSNEMNYVNIKMENTTLEQPVLVDILSGKVFKIPDSDIKRDVNGITFQKLPVYDSPVVITDRSLITLKD